MTHEAGKGSTQRPTDHDAFSKHFEAIFGKKPPEGLNEQVRNQVIDAVTLASDPAGLKRREKEE